MRWTVSHSSSRGSCLKLSDRYAFQEYVLAQRRRGLTAFFRRHSLAAGFCQLCNENLLGKRSITNALGHVSIECAQKNGMTF